jgi:hypothetical protein
MELRELVKMYLSLAGNFGNPVPLGGFGLDRKETERIFSVFDEDYHISRYFHFSSSVGSPYYAINGFDQTHVALDPEIRTIL